MPILTSFMNTISGNTPTADETSDNDTTMSTNVSNPTYIPSGENFLYTIFKDTKVSFFILLIIVVSIYVGIFFIVGKDSQTSESSGTRTIVLVLEVILWVMLIVVLYINFKNMNDENYNFQLNLSNIFNSKLAELDVKANDTEEDTTETSETSDTSETPETCPETDEDAGKEVFHIFGNKYTFNDARDICESYNARLASYDEVEKAYQNGATWCSYGWSKDQLAIFPTSKAVMNELKSIPGMQYSCGRQGVNGGYMNKRNAKFGINCYGIKPKPTLNDDAHVHALNHTPQLKYGRTVEQLNKKIQEDYIVSPFNKNKWSKH